MAPIQNVPGDGLQRQADDNPGMMKGCECMDKEMNAVSQGVKPADQTIKPEDVSLAETKKDGQKRYSYEDFLKIIETLRGENGCPWDRAQTHESLETCLLEEAYETVEAIHLKDDENLKEELGDVLLQVVMHAQIASEDQRFNMDDVVHGVAEKMIRRHPHIFGGTQADSVQDIVLSWEEIKKQEKQETSLYESLNRIPKALPANMRAQKVLKKAASGGYNYTHAREVQARVEQDFESLEKALFQGDQEQAGESIGLLIFDLVNLSRFLGVNVENSLTNVIEKFINRLGSVENTVKSQGLSASGLSPQLFKALWDL